MATTLAPLIPSERIENKIYLIRTKKVMVDSDLAELYGVETKVLNQAVKRNVTRFPKDFMFQLTTKEAEEKENRIWSGVVEKGYLRRPATWASLFTPFMPAKN